jgi:hypothetical protein
VYRVEVDRASDSTVVKVGEGQRPGRRRGRSYTVGMQQMASFAVWGRFHARAAPARPMI